MDDERSEMEIITFIHETDWNDFPEDICNQARRCLLDTLGAGISGHGTELSQIIHNFAASVYGGKGACLWLDGREVSPPGAALANGMTVDSLDIHDGHPLTKGHAGAALVPALFAVTPSEGKGAISGREFLATLIIGYEIALRAGIALHSTACDYHTSGAWNALGCAAMTARRLGLGREQTRHALGIAEYHGPRSQMMRCIDHPTMLKDGSGWGAMTGVSSALMARSGFTGAPALTVESDPVRPTWEDLGGEWRIMGQYFKPHAVCRWAQPSVEAALALQKTHQIRPENMRRISISTFHEAVRLSVRRPRNTEEAQYSLPFPVAAAMVYGKLSASELKGDALTNPAVLSIVDRMELIEDDTFSRCFPARRFARVLIETADGEIYDSGETEAKWDAVAPPTDTELREKFRMLTREQLSDTRADELETAVWNCAGLSDAAPLLALINTKI